MSELNPSVETPLTEASASPALTTFLDTLQVSHSTPSFIARLTHHKALLALIASGCALCMSAGLSLAFESTISKQKALIASPITSLGHLALPGEVRIGARAAAVYSLTDGEFIYEKKADELLPLASLTKLMTIIVALETLPRSDTVTISAEALATDGDSGLLPETSWNVGDLMDHTLVVSSNDGAEVLAEVAGNRIRKGGGVPAFVTRMNERAQELHLYSLSFKNPTGLDESTTVPGAVGSARDMALFLKYLYTLNASLLEATGHANLDLDGTSYEHNTNQALPKLPGFIAGKTGYTRLAGGNLIALVDRGLGDPIALVVLGSTREGRFQDLTKLFQNIEAR
jgi:D-alanyl-D-alanine carboxypeptidase